MLKTREIIFCAIAAACVGLGYAAIDIYLPALPTLKHDFSTTTVAIQSTLTIYLLGTIIAYLFLGPFAHYIGFRKMLLTLSITLLSGSIICMLSTTLWLLCIGRFIQALAGGGLGIIGRGSFMKYFPKEQAMYLYIAIVPAVSIMSPALAPTVGGSLVHHFNWQSIFLLLSILSMLLFFASLIYYHFPNHSQAIAEKINFSSTFKIYMALIFNRYNFAILFIPMQLFLIYMAACAEIPFILHHTGYNARDIGLAYIPTAIGFFMTSQLASHLTKHRSAFSIVKLGFMLVFLGLISLLILPHFTHNLLYNFVLPSALYLGCIGFINPVLIGKYMASQPEKAGFTASIVGAVTITGSAIGTQSVHYFAQGSVSHLTYYMLTFYFAALITFIYMKHIDS